MRGAAFLCSNDPETKGQSILVADIGGTTCDVGMLMPSGFPRQAAAFSVVGGVRINFPMPHVESIGLGGGSIVRETPDGIRIGPESVGSEILTRGIAFGGDTVTATDVTVANISNSEDANRDLLVGDEALVKHKFSTDFRDKFTVRLKKMLESVIDRMKTSPDPLPLLLVGGGSMIAPTDLAGTSKVILPPFFGVANAIGAAIGKISSVVDSIESITETNTTEKALKRIKEKAIAAAVTNGALESTVQISDVESFPLQYTANKNRFVVKAIGDVDFERLAQKPNIGDDVFDIKSGGEIHKKSAAKSDNEDIILDGATIVHTIDVTSYKPLVNDKREWIISEIDLEFITLGAYILGTGGGGSPYSMFLRLRKDIREGGIIRVKDIQDILKEIDEDGTSNGQDVVMCGFAGSPTVSIEQLHHRELNEAYEMLEKHFFKQKPKAIISLEIGGSNGLQSLYLASSSCIDNYCVDGDFMGRAYPTMWQITPYVLSERSSIFVPCSVSDGNGNSMVVMEAENLFITEKLIRASLSEIGSSVGMIASPIPVKDAADWSVTNSVSLSWRIGRAVFLARQTNQLDNVSQFIIDAVGGSSTAKEIFRGKIIGVERKLHKGHVYGEVIIEAIASEDERGTLVKQPRLRIPFKNENIFAKLQKDPDSDQVELIAGVPDLIAVVDAQNGEALGTPDYRYGLTVFVLAIACSDRWSGTEKGIAVGGPAGFDFDEPYNPVGKYVQPRSVIEEYASKTTTA